MSTATPTPIPQGSMRPPRPRHCRRSRRPGSTGAKTRGSRRHSPRPKVRGVAKHTPQALRARVTALPPRSSTGSVTRERCARRLSPRLGVPYIGLIEALPSRLALEQTSSGDGTTSPTAAMPARLPRHALPKVIEKCIACSMVAPAMRF
jgi:hypothetical protein